MVISTPQATMTSCLAVLNASCGIRRPAGALRVGPMGYSAERPGDRGAPVLSHSISGGLRDFANGERLFFSFLVEAQKSERVASGNQTELRHVFLMSFVLSSWCGESLRVKISLQAGWLCDWKQSREPF